MKYVYILRSAAEADRYYVGLIDDLCARLEMRDAARRSSAKA